VRGRYRRLLFFLSLVVFYCFIFLVWQGSVKIESVYISFPMLLAAVPSLRSTVVSIHIFLEPLIDRDI
jgi:hypothetical protein